MGDFVIVMVPYLHSLEWVFKRFLWNWNYIENYPYIFRSVKSNCLTDVNFSQTLESVIKTLLAFQTKEKVTAISISRISWSQSLFNQTWICFIGLIDTQETCVAEGILYWLRWSQIIMPSSSVEDIWVNQNISKIWSIWIRERIL